MGRSRQRKLLRKLQERQEGNRESRLGRLLLPLGVPVLMLAVALGLIGMGRMGGDRVLHEERNEAPLPYKPDAPRSQDGSDQFAPNSRARNGKVSRAQLSRQDLEFLESGFSAAELEQLNQANDPSWQRDLDAALSHLHAAERVAPIRSYPESAQPAAPGLGGVTPQMAGPYGPSVAGVPPLGPPSGLALGPPSGAALSPPTGPPLGPPSGPGGPRVARPLSAGVAHASSPGYRGQLHDEATGEIYLRHRQYDPGLGRFTAMDPIGLAGGLNMYGYCAGDPVNCWDPMGLAYIWLSGGWVHIPFTGTVLPPRRGTYDGEIWPNDSGVLRYGNELLADQLYGGYPGNARTKQVFAEGLAKNPADTLTATARSLNQTHRFLHATVEEGIGPAVHDEFKTVPVLGGLIEASELGSEHGLSDAEFTRRVLQNSTRVGVDATLLIIPFAESGTAFGQVGRTKLFDSSKYIGKLVNTEQIVPFAPFEIQKPHSLLPNAKPNMVATEPFFDALPNAATLRSSKRLAYMGKTPGKWSRTGLEVLDRMGADGAARINAGAIEIMTEAGQWIPIEGTDMSHIVDAVRFWNETGRFTGPKSPVVRKFMLDPENYILEESGPNRARGATGKERYLPPGNEE